LNESNEVGDWRAAAELLIFTTGRIASATIRRIEGQECQVSGYVSTLMSIQSAFEKAGIRLLDNDSAAGSG
jgi:hypothetical protein